MVTPLQNSTISGVAPFGVNAEYTSVAAEQEATSTITGIGTSPEEASKGWFSSIKGFASGLVSTVSKGIKTVWQGIKSVGGTVLSIAKMPFTFLSGCFKQAESAESED